MAQIIRERQEDRAERIYARSLRASSPLRRGPLCRFVRNLEFNRAAINLEQAARSADGVSAYRDGRIVLTFRATSDLLRKLRQFA